jgi:hypothetical protein
VANGSLDAMLQAEIGETADSSTEKVKSRQQAAMEAAPRTRAAMEAAGGAPEGNKNASKNKVSKNENDTPCLPKGTTSARRIARLKRDMPEAAKRLAAGEFKSVAAAERWSRGEEPHPAYPKKTALTWAKHWWEKLTPKERREFRAWQDEQEPS